SSVVPAVVDVLRVRWPLVVFLPVQPARGPVADCGWEQWFDSLSQEQSLRPRGLGTSWARLQRDSRFQGSDESGYRAGKKLDHHARWQRRCETVSGRERIWRVQPRTRAPVGW